MTRVLAQPPVINALRRPKFGLKLSTVLTFSYCHRTQCLPFKVFDRSIASIDSLNARQALNFLNCLLTVAIASLATFSMAAIKSSLSSQTYLRPKLSK